MRDDNNKYKSGSSDDNGKKGEMLYSRRNTLKGVGAASLFGLSGFTALNEPSVTIPIAKRGNQVINTTQVPKRWYNHTNRVSDILDRLHERFKTEPWHDYTAQGRGKDKLKGLHKHNIRIYAKNVQKAKENIPENVDGISISVKESREKHIDDHLNNKCDEHTGYYSCVPGGAHLSNSSHCWSSTCLVELNNNYYLMTSAHPYGDCDDGIAGSSTYHSTTNNVYIGDIYTYYHAYDFSLIEKKNNNINGFDNTIIGDSRNVNGAVTGKYCDKLISNYDITVHQGISTGETKGYLDEKVTFNECNLDVKHLKLTSNAGGGDSGGPHYWVNDAANELAMLGPHEWHTEKYGGHYRSFCPAAYAIQDQWSGLRFGGYSSTC